MTGDPPQYRADEADGDAPGDLTPTAGSGGRPPRVDAHS